LAIPSAGHAIPVRSALLDPASPVKARFSRPLATVRPSLNARVRSAFMPYRVSAAMSASAYGVTNTGCPAVAVVSPASQSAAAGLAGCFLPRHAPLWTALTTWYGLVMVATLASSAGSIAQVRFALGYWLPASSSPDSRPPLARLAASPLFTSPPEHMAWRG